MISKQEQKYVQSLHNKKYRQEYGEFIVEGEKGITELLKSDFEIINVYCTELYDNTFKNISNKVKISICNINQIEQMSSLKSNAVGLAVVKQKPETKNYKLEDNIILVLDDINDPGNLGTIIRIADWYGLSQIFCSKNTVDFYNNKVIAASMGSFSRINCHEIETVDFLKSLNIPIYGAYLEGNDVRQTRFENQICLVIGSESHGISKNLEELITHKVTIKSVGAAESLNAGVATGILLDNINRIMAAS